MSGTRSYLRERESDAHFACHELLHEHPWRRMPPRVAQLHAIEPCDLCATDSLSCLLTIAISRCWPRTLCAQGAMTYGSLSVSNIYLQMSVHAPPTRSRHLLPPLSPALERAGESEDATQSPSLSPHVFVTVSFRPLRADRSASSCHILLPLVLRAQRSDQEQQLRSRASFVPTLVD